MHIMRQLMAQHPSNIRIQPQPIVPIRTYPQLDLLAPVHVQAEEIRVLVRRELGEHPYGELVLAHYVADGGVVCEFREEAARGLGVGEVREGLDAVEGVLGVC